MPLPISLMAIGFFVWIAENLGTLLGAWRYPNQVHSWGMVDPAKATSWFLLVVVTFLIVAQLKHVKERRSRIPIGANASYEAGAARSKEA